MAALEEINVEEEGAAARSWGSCPSDLLLMIFEKVPITTVATCMFVNHQWKNVAEYFVERNNKWEEIINNEIINKGTSFKFKSKKTLSWKQMFYNYVLWNNIHKAEITLYDVQVINIKVINVYRDNLIVVTSKNVLYYHIEDYKLFRRVEITCQNFIETDYMIAIVQDDYDRYFQIYLFKKSSIDDFNIDSSNMHHIDKALFYEVECNRCYVLDGRNVLLVYSVLYPIWVQVFSARYYGNPNDSCGINVFDNQVYLMANGSVLWANLRSRNFKKMLEIKVPLVGATQSMSCKMFHRYGFVFGVGEKEKRKIDRFTLFKNNVFVYKLPNLSCMTQHGDLLFLGYVDGTVEFVSPRDISGTKPLRSFNIKDFKKDLDNVEVLGIQVYEAVGTQHMFVATHTEVLHLHIKHPNCESYMWSNYTNLVSLMVDESVEGLAFKNRTEMNVDVISEMEGLRLK